MAVKLPKLKCKYCKHEWTPRKSNVIRCPECNHCIKCGKAHRAFPCPYSSATKVKVKKEKVRK